MSEITTETRREGHEHIAPKTAKIETRIIDTLKIHPFGLTANEISWLTGISLNNIRSRLTELQGRQRVVAFDKKINPETGVRVAVWRLEA